MELRNTGKIRGIVTLERINQGGALIGLYESGRSAANTPFGGNS